ncbi:hypothetical protein ACOTVJ_05620 [Aliarcobacter butzleri]|uniref:hypothetical protein n=1 Tax=Aliarcobacter butzleri TaxID=28197 RepID=UPI00186A49EF|nr:hypothetical protein [Aliarcobacter butzleri]
MGVTMDNFFKKQLYVWTYEKIKSNPNKFGADGCNALFMQTYLKEIHGVDLPLSVYSTISTVSRIKSDLLLKNPQYDKRVKDRPKKRKKRG